MLLNNIQIVTIAAFNCEGDLLFGLRNDTSKWTLPSGHMEDGETPVQGAVRELREETGLSPLSLEHIGSEQVKPGIFVHAFQAVVDGVPTGKNDPDAECETWEFLSTHNGLSEGLLANLQHPKNVALRLLGLLDPYTPDHDKDDIDLLMNHCDPAEKRMALKLEGVQPRHLMQAFDSEDPVLHEAALAHPAVTPEVLAHLMRMDNRLGIQEKALDHKSAGQVQVVRLLKNLKRQLQDNPDSPEITGLVSNIFSNYNVDPIVINDYALDPLLPLFIRAALYRHPSIMPDILFQALSTQTYDSALREAAIKNPNAPTDLILNILKDPKESNSICMAAATCPRLTENDLDHILFYSDLKGYHPNVKQYALLNPHIQARHVDHVRSNLPAEESPEFEQQLNKFFAKNSNHVLLADMLGYDLKLLSLIEACKFLVGKKISIDIRTAMFEHDGDMVAAVLVAHGIAPTEENKQALIAIQELKDLSKSTVPDFYNQEVKAIVPEASEAATLLRQAFLDNNYEPISLKGKHTAGAILVHCPDRDYILKPGTEDNTPALGVNEETASQSRREAAFWQVAQHCGLGSYIPRADLVSIMGKEYAAIEMLPNDYINLDTRRLEGADAAQLILNPYVNCGTIWLWGALDWVLGSSDRHANNLMVGRKNDIKLIDHGSAFAGNSFSPGSDENSFVPYYLRFACVKGFNALSQEERLKIIPRASKVISEELKGWLASLDSTVIEEILLRYDIDPIPSLNRLTILMALSSAMSVDDALAQLWCGALVPVFE